MLRKLALCLSLLTVPTLPCAAHDVTAKGYHRDGTYHYGAGVEIVLFVLIPLVGVAAAGLYWLAQRGMLGPTETDRAWQEMLDRSAANRPTQENLRRQKEADDRAWQEYQDRVAAPAEAPGPARQRKRRDRPGREQTPGQGA
jgi:hypothetical protein